jgi:hypothetical protein
MRWFRVPTFSGIEAAADDADRGTLRLAEGCLPVGPGGLHSGPVWETIGPVSRISTNESNELVAAEDTSGNSVLLASRSGRVHDVKVFPVANTDLSSLSPCYDVPIGTVYNSDFAYLSAVGNRMVAFGDGSSEALFIGSGSPVAESTSSTPASTIYHLEYSKFPNCKFFVVGPQNTLFAAGDPENPLTIYVSEPAGLTQPDRDSLYSVEATSSVNLLMTDATEVVALSCVAGNVAAHTDAGVFLLSAPSPDQANTGYRVEQAPTSVASAAVNLQVVAGEDGTQPYYLGFDGQIWRDPSGPSDAQKAGYTDPVQPSSGAKGRWDTEHPADLSNSFSAYDPESGQYWVYIENEDFAKWEARVPPATPTGFTAALQPYRPYGFNAVVDPLSIVPPTPTSFGAAVDPATHLPNAPVLFGLTYTVPVPSAPTSFSAIWIAPPRNFAATATPSAPRNLVALATPLAPINFAATESITAPPAPTSFAALQQPAAPTGFLVAQQPPAPTDFAAARAPEPPAPTDFAALGSPAAPTSFAALGSPAAPTGFTALPELPANPLTFAARTLPSPPSDFSAIYTPIPPDAPTGFKAERWPPCDANAPCAGYYGGGYPPFVTVRVVVHPYSGGTWIGPLYKQATVIGDDWGHPEYAGNATLSGAGGGFIPVLLNYPLLGTSSTKLRVHYGYWGATPNYLYVEKLWSGTCNNERCLPYGTYNANYSGSFPSPISAVIT